MNPNETTPVARGGQGSARDFLAVLFRRRWVIGTVFAVTTVTVIAINLTQPLYFESTGKVIVKRGVRDNIMSGGMRTLTWEEELSSEVETVKSGVIVQRAQALLNETRAAEGRSTSERARGTPARPAPRRAGAAGCPGTRCSGGPSRGRYRRGRAPGRWG